MQFQNYMAPSIDCFFGLGLGSALTLNTQPDWISEWVFKINGKRIGRLCIGLRASALATGEAFCQGSLQATDRYKYLMSVGRCKFFLKANYKQLLNCEVKRHD